MKETRHKRPRPTLRDVAHEAGVSYQTVSRVLNESPNVSSDTRTRVLRVMREMNYRPNRAARTLATQRSYTLEAIIVDSWNSESAALSSMTRAAHNFGYQLSIVATTRDALEHTIHISVGRQVDGLVLITQRRDIEAPALLEWSEGVPFVQMTGDTGLDIPRVAFDQVHGTRLAVQHLLDLGHRQIAEITGDMRMVDGYKRHHTLRDLLAEHHLVPGPSVEGDFDINTGYSAVQQLLATGENFTAVFIANDWMAFSAVHAFLEHGLRVPEDISIVGFDDMRTSAFFTPPLTTVRQDLHKIGRLTIEYLVSLIEQPDTPVHQRLLAPELIVRASTRKI